MNRENLTGLKKRSELWKWLGKEQSLLLITLQEKRTVLSLSNDDITHWWIDSSISSEHQFLDTPIQNYSTLWKESNQTSLLTLISFLDPEQLWPTKIPLIELSLLTLKLHSLSNYKQISSISPISTPILTKHLNLCLFIALLKSTD